MPIVSPLFPSPVVPYCPQRGEVDVPLDFYLAANAPNASDDNIGSREAPLLTLDELLRRLQIIARVNQNAPVRCHIGSGTYAWTRTLGPMALASAVCFVGDGAGQPGDDGFTVLEPVQAASAANQFQVTGTFAADYQGKTIEILSGLAAGDRRTILDVGVAGAGVLRPAFRFSAVVAAGDTFRIVEPAIVVNPPSSVMGARPPLVAGVGSPGPVSPMRLRLEGDRPGDGCVLFANLAFVPLSTGSGVAIQDSDARFAGCEFVSPAGITHFAAADQSSMVYAGLDYMLAGSSRFFTPAAAGLAVGPLTWAGWGIHCAADLSASNVVAFRPERFAGVLSMLQNTASGLSLQGTKWFVVGGWLRNVGAANFNGFLLASGPDTLVTCRASDTQTPVRISTAGDNRSCGIRAVGGASVVLSRTEVTATAGCAVGAHAPESDSAFAQQGGVVSLVDGVTLTSERAGAVAMTGGRVVWRAVPTVAGTMAAGQAIITQSATNGAVVASSLFSVSDGVATPNPDGSGTVLMRVN